MLYTNDIFSRILHAESEFGVVPFCEVLVGEMTPNLATIKGMGSMTDSSIFCQILIGLWKFIFLLLA